MGRGAVKIHQASYDPSVAGLRDAMSHNDFDDAWAEGAALTTAEASATRSAVTANANARPAAGGLSPRPNSMSSGWSPTGLATRTSLHDSSSNLGPCKPSDPRLHQTRPHAPRPARPRTARHTDSGIPLWSDCALPYGSRIRHEDEKNASAILMRILQGRS